MTPSVHVLPLHDLIEHLVPGGIEGHDGPAGCWLTIEAGEDGDDDACPCVPRAEHVPNAKAGPDGWMYVHHSLDGREAHE